MKTQILVSDAEKIARKIAAELAMDSDRIPLIAGTIMRELNPYIVISKKTFWQRVFKK